MSLRHACFVLMSAAVAGCGDEGNDPRRPENLSAEVSENIATVVKVEWTTEEPTRGYVEYGPTRDMELTTPLESEESTEHSATLLGLVEQAEYFYRVVTWDGDNAGASEVRSIETGSLPGSLPTLDVEGEGHDQYTIVPILNPGEPAAVTIIDPEGQIVWYHTDDRDLDFYRARLSLDGKSIIYNAATVSGTPSEESELVRVALDGSESSSIPVPLLAHDFVQHDDGTVGAIVIEYRDFEGTEIRGDSIVEIDEDGEITPVWSAWDCFDPAETPGLELELGWTFANALDYDRAEDAYYLGMRNFSSIVKISRESWECEWVLGVTASTFAFASGSARFLHQHQFQVRGDRIVVMDNDGSIARDPESRIIEYQLDFEQMVATEVWSYLSDPPVYTFVLGEPTRLNDGSTFVNWSAAGQMDRVDENDERTWKVNTPVGYVFGFHELADSLYPDP
jgi:hypothetical protein